MNMKKIIYLFVIVASAITFNSCSSDDDSPEQDKLISKWSLFQEFENGQEIELSDCDKKGILEFKLDGSFVAEFFDLNQSTGECEPDDASAGVWKNKGSDMYDITSDGETETIKIIFDNDTFSITDIDGSDTYKEVYKRQ